MDKRIFIIVLDGFGVGEAPDANLYGDEGSNTFLNLNKVAPLDIPNLTKLGLKAIDGMNLPFSGEVEGCYAKMRELSKGKDTTTGHFEMMDIISKNPYPTFPNGFSQNIIDEIIQKAELPGVLGNCVASGTEIVARLGDEHLRTRKPIIYTSADSVLQIATHIDVYSLDELYKMCEIARKIMVGENGVSRIIARPFAGKSREYYRLSSDRRDFSLKPPMNNSLVRIMDAGFDTIAVGKIIDIFAGVGITKTYTNHTNIESLNVTLKLFDEKFNGLAFVNLVDTDMLYGHRNDVKGYKESLEQTDKFLGKFLEKMKEDDVLIITGDHGCDPTTPSTDHSREYTPLLCYSKKFKQNVNLHIIDGFNCIGEICESYLGLRRSKLLDEILK